MVSGVHETCISRWPSSLFADLECPDAGRRSLPVRSGSRRLSKRPYVRPPERPKRVSLRLSLRQCGVVSAEQLLQCTRAEHYVQAPVASSRSRDRKALMVGLDAGLRESGKRSTSDRRGLVQMKLNVVAPKSKHGWRSPYVC